MRTLSPTVVEQQPAGSGRVINPLRSLLKHRLIAALVFCGAVLIGLPVAWMKGRATYRAEGVLYVSPRFLRNLDSDEEQQLQSNSQYREFMQQQIRTVNRYDILASVLKQPAMSRVWKKTNESERRAIERLQRSLQVLPVADTYQVTVALEDERPEGIAELINAVMAEFTTVAQKEALWDADGRLEKLQQEKANLTAEIAGLIERKTGMSQQLGTTVFNEGVINSYDKRLSAGLEALEEARRQRFSAEAALSGQAAPGLAATAMDKALSDSGLTSLKATLNQRKAALLTSIQGLSPQHSGRIAAERELKEIESQIERATDQLHGRIQAGIQDIQQSRYEQARQLEQKIQKEVEQLRGQAEAYSRGYQTTLEIGEELSRLRKRLSATEDRINFLTLETKAPGSVRVFSPARVPETPFQGGRKRRFLMVLAAALLLAATAPVAVDALDPRIMTGKELEALLGMPLSSVLASSGAGEGARRLAVVLHRHAAQLPRKAVVVSGASPLGDSAAVALSAGSALCSLGLRALVIEARAGSTDNRYRNAHPGMAELLAGRARWEECVIHGDCRMPDRIATGGTPEEECLLPADRIIPILADVTAHYDIVLIDAAPVTHSLATEELVRLTGAVLLVAEAERDTKIGVKAALTLLERLQPQAFGAVLNGAPLTALWTKKKMNRNHHEATSLLAA